VFAERFINSDPENENHLEQEFLVQPGADPAQVASIDEQLRKLLGVPHVRKTIIEAGQTSHRSHFK
jgi:cell division protein FtsX